MILIYTIDIRFNSIVVGRYSSLLLFLHFTSLRTPTLNDLVQSQISTPTYDTNNAYLNNLIFFFAGRIAHFFFHHHRRHRRRRRRSPLIINMAGRVK